LGHGVLITKKSHTPFRLPPKSTTFNHLKYQKYKALVNFSRFKAAAHILRMSWAYVKMSGYIPR